MTDNVFQKKKERKKKVPGDALMHEIISDEKFQKWKERNR